MEYVAAKPVVLSPNIIRAVIIMIWFFIASSLCLIDPTIGINMKRQSLPTLVNSKTKNMERFLKYEELRVGDTEEENSEQF